MSKKIEITEIQKAQFNLMYATLKTIANNYQTPESLRKNSAKQFGLEYEEALEMSYENIQNDATQAIKRVKYIADKIKEAP